MIKELVNIFSGFVFKSLQLQMRKSARNVNRKVYTEPNEDNETSEEEEDSQHKEHDEKVIQFDWCVTWFNL